MEVSTRLAASACESGQVRGGGVGDRLSCGCEEVGGDVSELDGGVSTKAEASFICRERTSSSLEEDQRIFDVGDQPLGLYCRYDSKGIYEGTLPPLGELRFDCGFRFNLKSFRFMLL